MTPKEQAAILIAVAMLTACSGEPESTQKVGIDFKVETLFTIDGCTVYRFYDAGTRYFTNCKGSTSWQESCGKACNRDVSIEGGK